MRLFYHCLVMFFGLSLCMALPALAREDGLVTEAEVQKALSALDESKLSPAELREFQDVYQTTLQALRYIRDVREQMDRLARQLGDAPGKTGEFRRELSQMQPVDEEKLAKKFFALPLNELERLQSAKQEQFNNWRNEMAKVNGDLITAQTRPERAQAEIANNQLREEALSATIKRLQRQSDNALSVARMNMHFAEMRGLQLSTQLLRQQLAENVSLLDYSVARSELLSRRTDQLDQELQLLQLAINERRRELSEKAVSEATMSGSRVPIDDVLNTQNQINLKLSNDLLAATGEIARLTGLNTDARQQMDRLTQIEQALSAQIAVLKDSFLLSRILQQQKKALPHIRLDNALPDQVAAIRLRQFELSQERESLGNPPQVVEQLLSANAEDVTPAYREELLRLVSARADLLARLNSELGSVLNLAISLQIAQQQIQQVSNGLQGTLDEQLFWIASNRPLDLVWLKGLSGQLANQVAAMPWLEVPTAALNSLVARPLASVMLVLLVVVYVYRRKSLLSRLRQLNDEVGQFNHDSVWHTPQTLLLNALLVAPFPLALAVVGGWLRYDPISQTPGLGVALLNVAFALFMLRLFVRVLRTGDIAERHFRWENTEVTRLRRMVRSLTLVVLPLMFVISMADQNPASMSSDALGILVMLFGCLSLGVMFWRFMLNSPPIYNSRVLHFMAGVTLVALPLALLVMVGMGYYYTAIKLADRYVGSLYLLAAWLLASGVAERSLRVAANRLGYQRAIARREAGVREGAEGEVVVDLTELNMQQVNQQSSRIVSLCLLSLFGLLMYWIWADLITVFAYLDGVILWEYTAGVGENAVQVPISVRDMLGALVVIILTTILARNLPGLLEMLLLSRLDLRQGSSYAITSLLSYVIVGFGVVSTLSTLGVSWDKLQWLVAALSVGLGFGLQEIFANFISGIIILFERPVRIGDTITIGNLSGTVSRIRIRATTITDPDRKEIIVPNKTFVTDQLINWTLSDTITRIVVRVGVSYGSDLELVRSLMLQAAEANARVLKEPAPVVLFLVFGASTLDHELRVHVSELGDRMACMDEINRQLDILFREHGIEVSYQQVDVHLRNSEGLEQFIRGLGRPAAGD